MQLLASVGAPILATQPLPVDELGTSPVRGHAAPAETLDRFEVQVLGVLAVGQECARTRLDSLRPVGSARAGSRHEGIQRSARGLSPAGSGFRLDELEHRPGGGADRCFCGRLARCLRGKLVAAGKGGLEDRGGVLGDGRRSTPSPRAAAPWFRASRRSSAAGSSAARRRELKRDVRERGFSLLPCSMPSASAFSPAAVESSPARM